MQKMYNFEKEDKIFSSNCEVNSHPDGTRYMYKIFLNLKEITKSFVEWYDKGDNHFHLSYIGFKEEFRSQGLLKNFIHPHCIKFMKNKNVEIITLKPLATAFIIWVKLGFEMKKTEELQIKQLIKEFLLEQNIITEDFGKISLKEIITNYQKFLNTDEFPPKLEKAYYTNFKKVLK